MAANPTILSNAKTWWGGYDFGSFANHVTLGESQGTLDAAVFGDTGVRRVNRKPQITMGMDGYFDQATINANLKANISTSGAAITVVPEGSSEGNTAFLFRSMIGEYTLLDGQIDEIARFNFQAVGGKGIQSRLPSLFREANISEFEDHPDFAHQRTHVTHRLSQWDESNLDGAEYAWGMTIDLN